MLASFVIPNLTLFCLFCFFLIGKSANKSFYIGITFSSSFFSFIGGATYDFLNISSSDAYVDKKCSIQALFGMFSSEKPRLRSLSIAIYSSLEKSAFFVGGLKQFFMRTSESLGHKYFRFMTPVRYSSHIALDFNAGRNHPFLISSS